MKKKIFCYSLLCIDAVVIKLVLIYYINFFNTRTDAERIIPSVIAEERRPVELHRSVLQQQFSVLNPAPLCFSHAFFVHLFALSGPRLVSCWPTIPTLSFYIIYEESQKFYYSNHILTVHQPLADSTVSMPLLLNGSSQMLAPGLHW